MKLNANELRWTVTPGCYRMTGVNNYVLLISYVVLRGGKISVHGLRGGQVFRAPMPRGASFQCSGLSEFLRPTVAINNDRSLNLLLLRQTEDP